MPRKAFRVEEVNALLPELEALLAEVERLRREVQAHHDQLQILNVLWGEKVGEPGNPDHRELLTHRGAVENAVREIDRIAREEITGRGIRFPQGGLELGLLDFPTTLDGRWVYLCWQRGEPEVQAWHELSGGFAGRRPITAEHRLRMGRGMLPDDSLLDF
ncbi:MAG: DUF2203 domain-containing protein [Gemmatimonadota bacterium]|nr:DUF2203 domain-containing protein [Gemmatimonadota bacterium]